MPVGIQAGTKRMQWGPVPQKDTPCLNAMTDRANQAEQKVRELQAQLQTPTLVSEFAAEPDTQ